MADHSERAFADRRAAGQELAAQLRPWTDDPTVVIVALPRGGVPVAAEVAAALHAPLDVLAVRKLGAPGQEELAVGAIAAGGARVLNHELLRSGRVSAEQLQRITAREETELDRRQQLYEHSAHDRTLDAAGRTVIVIDDGLATGATMHAAVVALRELHAETIVVAVPVGAPSTCERLEQIADTVICPHRPDPFEAVGYWYRDFRQVGDDEVRRLLSSAARSGR